ncbi:MAG: hypothetical protein IPM51_05610 [Sphingobacteriaceae bacterium]|nr:hypothetical protein [Sphingobacteriaceae bacterium]
MGDSAFSVFNSNPKPRLKEYCIQLVQQNINALSDQLNQLKDAAQQENKSSAGDKHETGRAMLHLEEEKVAQQMISAENQLQNLFKIQTESDTENIKAGSLLATNKGFFYLATGIGSIQFENKEVKIISPSSPLAQKFMGNKNEFDLNGNQYSIQEII